MNCYRDVKWSATYGSFFSSKACEVLKPKYPPRKSYPSRSAKEMLMSGEDTEDIPVLDNFEKESGDEVVTEAHPIEAVSSEVVFSPTRAPRPVEVTEAHPLEAESAELGRPTRAPRASVEVTEPHPLSETVEVED